VVGLGWEGWRWAWGRGRGRVGCKAARDAIGEGSGRRSPSEPRAVAGLYYVKEGAISYLLILLRASLTKFRFSGEFTGSGMYRRSVTEKMGQPVK
jgi:hypothetical protein